MAEAIHSPGRQTSPRQSVVCSPGQPSRLRYAKGNASHFPNDGTREAFQGVFCTSRPGLGDEKDTQRALQDDTECPNGTECPNRLSGRAAITRSLSTLPQTPSGQPPTKMRGYPEEQMQHACYQPLPNQAPDNPLKESPFSMT